MLPPPVAHGRTSSACEPPQMCLQARRERAQKSGPGYLPEAGRPSAVPGRLPRRYAAGRGLSKASCSLPCTIGRR
jgi:hypothetical protein